MGTRGGFGKKGCFSARFDLVPVAVVPRPFALLLLLLLLGFFLPVLLLFPFLVLPVTPVPAVAVAARPAAAARAGPPHRRLARDQASDHKARAVEGIRTSGWALRAVCIDGGRSSAPRAHRARWRRVEARRELCGLVSDFRLLKVRRDHSERSLLGARAVTMSARMRRALAIALIIVLLVCPQRANGARNPEPTHEPAPSRLGAHPSHGSNPKPSLTLPSLPDAGQFLSKFIGKNVRRVWKNRRDAAAEGRAPVGWLDRTFDWLDGRVSEVLNRVPLGRSPYDEETAAREWKETFGDDGSFEASTAAAARRGSRPRGAGGRCRGTHRRGATASRIRPGGSWALVESQPQTTKAKEKSQPEAMRRRRRKPKFKRKGRTSGGQETQTRLVFTMGGRDDGGRRGGRRNRNKPREPEYKDAEDSGGSSTTPSSNSTYSTRWREPRPRRPRGLPRRGAPNPGTRARSLAPTSATQ